MSLARSSLKRTAVSTSPQRVEIAIRYGPNPLPYLTPVNLAFHLDSFMRGYLRDCSILWNMMEWRDDRVGADAEKRYKSIARYPYRVIPASGVDPKAPAVQRHVEAIKFALDHCTARAALDSAERGGAALLVRQMMRAVGYKWQVHELVWQPRPDGLTFEAIACPLWWFERLTGTLRYLEQDLLLEGDPLEPDGWMITRGSGLLGATSLLYLLKRMSLTDWSLYNGRVGPGIHGTTSAAPGSQPWKDLESAVDAFGFDLKIVTQDGVTITPIDCALKGTLPWPEMHKAMCDAITILWRGGNLMTNSGGRPDQTGVTLQGKENEMIEQDDAEMISDTLNAYLVPPLIRARFNEEPLAWVQWQTGSRPEIEASIKTDQFLASAGWQFTQEDLAERYSRTPPQPGQTVLTPPKAQKPESPFGGLADASNSAVPAVASAMNDLIANSLDKANAARAAAMKPLQPWIAKLNALLDEASGPDLAESAFLDRLQALLDELPKYVPDIGPEAKVLTDAMTSAVINAVLGVETSKRSNQQEAQEGV